jgi:hypothetical protein
MYSKSSSVPVSVIPERADPKQRSRIVDGPKAALPQDQPHPLSEGFHRPLHSAPTGHPISRPSPSLSRQVSSQRVHGMSWTHLFEVCEVCEVIWVQWEWRWISSASSDAAWDRLMLQKSAFGPSSHCEVLVQKMPDPRSQIS